MRAYAALVWMAFLWALANCVYVYIFREGVGTYRVESAVIALIVALLPRAIRTAADPPPRVELSRHASMFLAVVAVATWAAIYAPLVTLPFLSDDYVFLDRYRQFGDVAKVGQFFRPFFAAVFWFVSTTFSGSPVPFHLTSLALHLASACLIYTLAARVFLSSGPAIACFVVFLLNPLQLEAVLWISGLQELLWAFGVLAALVVYTGAQHLSPIRIVATMALLAMALLSKETAISYVLLVPLTDLLLFRGERGALLRLAYGWFAAELVGYLIARSLFVEMEPSFFVEPTRYLFKQFVTLPYRFFVQPWNVVMIETPRVVLCASAMLAIAMLFWTVAIRRASRGVWIGVCLILASTAPLYSYFFVRDDLASARYLYLATAGWAIIVATFAAAVVSRPHPFAAAVAALAVVLAVSLHLNVRPWRVAGEVIAVMQSDLAAGHPPGARLAEWSARNGVELSLLDAVPREYGGVGIFINGYDEFIKIHFRH